MSSNSCLSDTYLLQVQDLSGGPGSKAIFKNLSFSWPAGLNWIHGDEGTGKTSLLRILAGNLRPISGLVHRSPGGVFWAAQNDSSHESLSVQAYWDNQQSQYPLWCAELVEDLSRALDMERHRHKRLDMLSTGSRRKVMLIAALCAGTRVTLLDQPFAALDATSVGIVKDFLTEAADHPSRAWIVADYETPEGMPMASVLKLGT